MFLSEYLRGIIGVPEASKTEPQIEIDKLFYSVEDLRETRKIIVDFKGVENTVKISGSTWMDGTLAIVFNGDGNSAEFGSGGYIGSDTTLLFHEAGPGTKSNNCRVVVGDRFKLNGNAIQLELGEAGTTIMIGDDFLCASGVRMITSDGHSVLEEATGRRLNPAGNISIGNRVWLSRDVTIMSNTAISSDTVVAARSIVTKRFSEGKILLAGAPAVVKKRGIVWTFELSAGGPPDLSP